MTRRRRGLMKSMGAVGMVAFYIAANGTGNGKTINNPSPFSAAIVNSALAAGKIVKMIGPAVTPALDAPKRADEFPEDPYGHIVTQAGVIDFIKHPSNPDGPNGQFCGSRKAWVPPADSEEITDVSTGFAVGGNGFVFRAPVIVTGLSARRMGTVINFDTPNVANASIIQDYSARNIQRFQDTLDNLGTTNVRVDDLIFRRGVLDGYSKAAHRAMDYSQGWVFEDITGNSRRQANDSFARLIVFDYFSHNMIVRRCVGRNSHMTTGQYWNGDSCVEWNDGNHDIYLEDCEGYGSTDGGIDGKGFNNTIIRGIFGNNKRNIRCWGESTYIGGTSIAPHNRGDTTNGRCHAFIAGYSEPNRATDPLAGFRSSRFRGLALIEDYDFITTGQDAGTALILTEPGSLAHIVNSRIDGVPLTYANTGTTQINDSSKVIIYQGSKDPAVINCQITTPASHTTPETAVFNLQLTSTSAASGSAINTDCRWELDRNDALITSNTVTLNSWCSATPVLTLIAPTAPNVFTFDVTCVDAAKNRVTRTLTVTAVAVNETDAPVIASNGILAATKTGSSVTNNYPASKFAFDVIWVSVYSNAVGVDHPSIPGFTLVPELSNVQSTTFKTWKLYRRLDGSEGSTFTTTFWSDAGETTLCSAVNNTTSHTVNFINIRFAKQTGTPFESPTVLNIGQPPVPPPLPAPQTYVTPTKAAGCSPSGVNRLMLAVLTGRNDITDGVVDVSTPEWKFNDAQWFTGASSGDMTFTSVTQVNTEIRAYTGANLFWTKTTRTFHLTDCVAFLPRA